MRALARSLAKDFRDAVDQSRLGGETTGRALRDGIRGMANEAGRGMRSEWRQARRGFGPGFGPGRGRWGPPWAPGPPRLVRARVPETPPVGQTPRLLGPGTSGAGLPGLTAVTGRPATTNPANPANPARRARRSRRCDATGTPRL